MLSIVLIVGIFFIHNVELRMSDFNNAEEYSCSVCGVSREEVGGLDVKYVEQYTFLFQLTALAIKSPSCCCRRWVRCVSACGLRSTLCSELRLVSCRQIKPLTFNLLLQSQPLWLALMKHRDFFWGGGGDLRGSRDRREEDNLNIGSWYFRIHNRDWGRK